MKAHCRGAQVCVLVQIYMVAVLTGARPSAQEAYGLILGPRGPASKPEWLMPASPTLLLFRRFLGRRLRRMK